MAHWCAVSCPEACYGSLRESHWGEGVEPPTVAWCTLTILALLFKRVKIVALEIVIFLANFKILPFINLKLCYI